MDYFDLHCDTVTAVANGKTDVAITSQKALCFDNYTQTFAIWLPDGLDAKAAFKKAKSYYDFYREYVLNFSRPGFSSLLTLENASAFGDDLEKISFWAQRGVRAVTLTWNGANALGFGSSLPDEGGLTHFGKEALKVMQSFDILCDVSHLNSAGFYDCINLSKLPPIASHSNCAAVCNHRRNLDDDRIKALFSANGLLGLCFYPQFLGHGDVFELIYEHIYHALDLGGENNLAFGSDFDGAVMDDKLSSLEQINALWRFLLSKGFDTELLERIFFKNSKNFFDNVLHK